MNASKLCRSCKYYITDRDDVRHGQGVCTLAYSEEGSPTVQNTKAYAVDSDEYHAWLVVSDDYGCVMHASLTHEKALDRICRRIHTETKGEDNEREKA